MFRRSIVPLALGTPALLLASPAPQPAPPAPPQGQQCLPTGYPPLGGTVFDHVAPLGIAFEEALDVRWSDLLHADEQGNPDNVLELVYWGVGPTQSDGNGPELTVFRRRSDGTWEGLKLSHPEDPFYDFRHGGAADRLAGYYDVVFTDLDGDGDDDLLCAGNGNYEHVLEFDSSIDKFVDPGVRIGVKSEYWWCSGGESGPVVSCMTDTSGGPPCTLESSLIDFGAFPRSPGDELCDRRWAMGVAAGDVDGDGDDDAVFVYRDTRPALFLNDGSGIDTAASSQPLVEWQLFQAPPDELKAFGTPLPLNPPQQRYYGDSTEALQICAAPGVGGRDVHLADLDHDGDLDCIVGRYGGNGNCFAGADNPSNECFLNPYRTPVVYENVGFDLDCDDQVDQTGLLSKFRSVPFRFWYRLLGPDLNTCGFNAANSIEVADIDGDGFDDVIVPVDDAPDPADPSYRDSTLKTRVYLNDGFGRVGADVTTVAIKCNAASPEVACYAPTLLLGGANDDTSPSSTATVADWTGDGVPDVAIGEAAAGAAQNGVKDKLWVGTAPVPHTAPTFTRFDTFDHVGCLVPPCPPGDETRYVHAVDVDGDGDLDYLETNFLGSQSRIFLNRKSDVRVIP